MKSPQPRVAAAPPAPATPWSRLQAGLHMRALGGESRVAEARRDWLTNPAGLEALLQRSHAWLPLLLGELESRGLPAELALLPAVESGFDPAARSHAGAAGLWQFMPATAREAGLGRDWWYDGRYDPLSATSAALNHLQALHREFGDWPLAIAAYNAGAGAVRRALAATSRDGIGSPFWRLDLPGETERYVPRLLALSELVRAPQVHGLQLPEAEALRRIDLGGPLELALAARLAGLQLSALRALNPGHRRWALGPRGPFHLLLPESAAWRLEQGLAGLPGDRRVAWDEHRIRPGETLIGIARRHDTEVAVLREVNGISGHLIRAGQRLLVPRGTGRERAGPQLYQVRSGDSLWSIAHRHGLSVAQLRDWNALRSDRLKPGQRLQLNPGEG